MKTVTEKIIEAIKEKEDEINSNTHIKVSVTVQDGEALLGKLEILWKPKK